MTWSSNGNAERKLKARLRAEGRPCHICGQPIRLTACPPATPWSFDGRPRGAEGRGAGAVLDYANLDAAHRICNQRKGKYMPGDARPVEIRRTRLF